MKFSVCVLTILLAGIPGSAHQDRSNGPQSASGQVRQVYRVPGKPLVSQLRATDRVLEVIDTTSVATSGPPPGKTLLEVMTEAADIIAIVKVAKIQGRLVRSADWVESIVTTDVVESFKNRSATEAGQTMPLSFVYSSAGELIQGHQIVRARHADARLFVPGRSYLLFGLVADGELQINDASAFWLDGETAQPMTTNRSSYGLLPTTRTEFIEGIRASLQKAPARRTGSAR